MRKKIFFTLVFCLLVSHTNAAIGYFMGMRNQRDAFIGISYDGWGIALDHGILPQSFQKQYARIAPFYEYSAAFGISGYYLLYAGWRYDGQYNDYGAVAHLEWDMINGRLFILGTYQPFYDSFLGLKNGYGAWLKIPATSEIAFQVGVKNLPEYRDVERRYSASMEFKSEHLCVRPELSVPMTNNFHKMRVSLSFIYGADFN